MNILITGGTGFIGSHLIERLLKEKKHKIIVLKRKTSNLWRIKDFVDQLTFYDIDDLKSLEKVFQENKIDLIIHLATNFIKDEEIQSEINKGLTTNIILPTNLLYLALRYKVKFFINTGTCFEYKSSNKIIKESSKLDPINLYAATKISFESILKYFCKNKKIKAITLKLSYLYGEKDDHKKLINSIIKHLIEKKPLDLTEGKQKLDYIYVKDIIEAYIKSIDLIKKIRTYEVFNIGSGKTVSVKKIVSILEYTLKIKSNFNFGKIPYEKNHIMFLKFDIKKAKKILNWEPKYSIEEGLRETCKYYLKNREI